MLVQWRNVGKITLALVGFAGYALGQGLTISARPGLVNYFEGEAFLNGNPLVQGIKEAKYLAVGDTFEMRKGKGEILLMPGTFARVGDFSQIRMISPSLTNVRLELLQGEAIIEVIGLMRGSQIEILDQGALVTIEKDGLYRFNAGAASWAAVIEGSARVTLLGQTVKLGKGRQTGLVGILESIKFDLAADDDLYAWSSVRSQYEAAASYDTATRLAQAGQYGAVGWYFNDVLDCWSWLPFGSFFSHFGWGFYSPVTVGGAIIVKCPVVNGGTWHKGHKPGDGDGDGHRHWVGLGTTRPVAINPKHPPALSMVTGSPKINQEVRSPGFKGFLTSPANRASRDSGTHLERSSTAGVHTSGNSARASGGRAHSAGAGGAMHASSGGGGGHAGGSAGSGAGGGSHASAPSSSSGSTSHK